MLVDLCPELALKIIEIFTLSIIWVNEEENHDERPPESLLSVPHMCLPFDIRKDICLKYCIIRESAISNNTRWPWHAGKSNGRSMRMRISVFDKNSAVAWSITENMRGASSFCLAPRGASCSRKGRLISCAWKVGQDAKGNRLTTAGYYPRWNPWSAR